MILRKIDKRAVDKFITDVSDTGEAPSSAQRTRRLLAEWGQASQLISRRQREITEYRKLKADAYGSLNAVQLTGMPRGGKPELTAVEQATDRVGRVIPLYDRQIALLELEIQGLIALRRTVDEWLCLQDVFTQHVIHKKYADGKSYGEAAFALMCSISSVKRAEHAFVEYLSERVSVEIA